MIDSGDILKRKPRDRLKRVVDVSSSQFVPDIIDSLARARGHLVKGRTAVAVELLRAIEARLTTYNKVIQVRPRR